MKKSKKSLGKKAAIPAVTVLLASSLIGCSNDSAETSGKAKAEKTSKPNITIMTTAFSTTPITDNSPALQALEKYTGADITVNYVMNSVYNDKLNVTLASGNLPKVIMIPDKLPSFVSAVRNDAFWDLTKYLKDYPNLSKANKITLENSAIDGKIYGIYRARPLGRTGIYFRKDWLDKLGLEQPKTIDDFYNVLKAFTNDDPDGNGKDDTYGMVISKYTGPFDVMQTWFGAPNKWGLTKDGKLQPDFMTKEYMDALKFFKKLYDEKLINQDFAVMDSGKWDVPFQNGQAGLIVNVLDQAHRNQTAMEKIDPKLKDVVDVMGAVEGPEGLHNLPTAGYSGMLAIPKSSVKTEKELKQVLSFLDKLNNEPAQTIAYAGVEGRHYKMENGKFTPLVTSTDPLFAEFQDLNQFIPGIPEENFKHADYTPLQVKEKEIIKDNEKIVVANPAASLLSEVYAQKGQQLDNIINDARIKYIVGQIDEQGFKDAIKLWKSSGGDDYTDEINKLYKESKSKSKK
ncbi:extracellular solute-binding protein [Neobacillus dielmonensis]|uniref:extracellular solute-binding protein n=1 Tax=Neobacillus dielmonensis TaxID=1347369 RepID=UPI0005A7F265|nr:extracellular solute-binding protein [Neobacillus dielmonensis]